MGSLETLQIVLQWVWVPILGVIWNFYGRIIKLESSHEDIQRLQQSIDDMDKTISAIAVKIGVLEDRRH